MKFRGVHERVLSDTMKIAQARERLEQVITELQGTMKMLEDILEGRDHDRVER